MKNKSLVFAAGCCLWATGVFAQNPNFSYTQTCFGNQTTLTASSSLPDASIASWMWDVDGNGTYDLSGKTIITLITINDTVAVKLKITPNAGTPDSLTKNVIIDPLPQVNFMANNLCATHSATYISLSNIAPGSISQFLWDFNNDGVTDDNSNDTVQYTCGPPSTYITKLTCVSNKGCSAFAQKTTTVYPNPGAAFTAANTCVNSSAPFTNTSTVTNLDFYLWQFGDGNSSSTSGNATHTYASAGTYTVGLIAITQSGCRDTVTHSITVNALPLVTITPGGSTTLCSGNSVVLDPGNSFASYSWSTGSSAPSVSVSATGNYSVTVTDANGCSNIASIPVMVNPLPVVSISASNTNLHNGGSVTLIANGANYYTWNTGANAISITTDSIGIYIVNGTDLNGCSASANITIVGENNTDTLSVSGSILTPNGDGFNDELIINDIAAYQNCELNVFNMWNERVYSKRVDKNNAWKGTNNNGDALGAGPYYYIIKCDGKQMLKGNINILR